MTSILALEADWPRERIDRDYSARATVTVEVFEAEMRRYRDLSQAMKAHCGSHFDVVYDEASGQKLDIYGVSADPRPVFMFIHGGYWRMLSKNESAFMAGALARRGVATVVVDYRLAPAATLIEIVREVRAAVAFLWRQGRGYGLDPDRIYVGGSSAGGHLTGSVISGGWHEAFGVPEDVVKGAMPISGLFHLAPIARSFVQEWMPLDEQAVSTLSPAETLPRNGCPIVLAYADSESGGFRRQSTEYDRLWREAGFSSELVEVSGRNHFDVVLDLAVDESLLTQKLVGLIENSSSPRTS
jgi:arylformamidase